MDPYSAEGELINIHNHFHQGQYQEVIDFDTSGLSSENDVPAKVLVERARIALGQAEDVLAELKGESAPEFAAVSALALSALGKTDEAVEAIEKLAESEGENQTVQVLGGTVLHAAGKSEEALALLSRHSGSLDAVALITQIHLQQNRTDLAVKEVTAARRWAQDSILVNLAESWVGLRVVGVFLVFASATHNTAVCGYTLHPTNTLNAQGGEKYQQAFYVFEELAQAPATSSIISLVSQAVSELHLGRVEEAQTALEQAIQKEPEFADAIANQLVLTVVTGKDAEQLKEQLKGVAPQHPLLVDIEEKSELFDKAASKFSAKVAA
ncbi:coatomer epsilon subunit-domain-containing protein [Xylariaceae sp. FL1272]|nr:coatomer epsilon subunit-domain-containing protein [Xylariaceae sp. FL1272]